MDMPISIRKDADRDADANASAFFSKDDPMVCKRGAESACLQQLENKREIT